MNFLVTGNPPNGYKTLLSIMNGETVNEVIQFLNSPDLPVDLTGYTIKIQINFATPLLLSTNNGGITFFNAVNGQIQLNISSANTGAFSTGSFPYDLWLESPNGINIPWLSGDFIVNPSVTLVP